MIWLRKINMVDSFSRNSARFIRICVFGMTQDAFGDLLGVGQSLVSYYEKNRRIDPKHWPLIREKAREMHPDTWSDDFLFSESLPGLCPIHGAQCTRRLPPQKQLGRAA